MTISVTIYVFISGSVIKIIFLVTECFKFLIFCTKKKLCLINNFFFYQFHTKLKKKKIEKKALENYEKIIFELSKNSSVREKLISEKVPLKMTKHENFNRTSSIFQLFNN